MIFQDHVNNSEGRKGQGDRHGFIWQLTEENKEIDLEESL